MSAVIPVQRGTMPKPEKQKSQSKMAQEKPIRGTLSIRIAEVMFMDG